MREISFEQAGWPEFVNIVTEVFSDQGALLFKARGSSMYPFIRDGDILTIQPVDTMDLKKGDIALYRTAEDKLVTHRIVGKYLWNSQVVLKARGDSVLGPIEHIHTEQVMGLVVGTQRRQRIIKLHQGFRKFWSLLWIRFYPVFQMIIWSLKKIKRATFLILHKFHLLKENHI